MGVCTFTSVANGPLQRAEFLENCSLYRSPKAGHPRCEPRLSVRKISARRAGAADPLGRCRSEEHTSELQSRGHLVCRLLLEKKKLPHLVVLQVHKLCIVQDPPVIDR